MPDAMPALAPGRHLLEDGLIQLRVGMDGGDRELVAEAHCRVAARRTRHQGCCCT